MLPQTKDQLDVEFKALQESVKKSENRNEQNYTVVAGTLWGFSSRKYYSSNC